MTNRNPTLDASPVSGSRAELTFAPVPLQKQFSFAHEAVGHRKSKVVLGVDRSSDAERMNRPISGAGYTFLLAETGIECLALVRRIQPRLIIIEIDLPHLSGFETCKRLRADSAYHHIPIVFYTNRNAFEDVRGSIDVGANDYILKSAGPGRLLSRVNHWTCRFVRPAELYRVHSARRMLAAA